jgi:hypothetical protein
MTDELWAKDKQMMDAVDVHPEEPLPRLEPSLSLAEYRGRCRDYARRIERRKNPID